MVKWSRNQRHTGRRGKEERMTRYGKRPSLCVPLKLESKVFLFPGNTYSVPFIIKPLRYSEFFSTNN